MTTHHTPSPVSDETAWLVEETWSGYVHYIHRDFDVAKWWRERNSLEALPFQWVPSGTGGAILTRRDAKVPFITKNVDEAMRFATKDGADGWIARQPTWFRHSDQFQSREHMWSDTPSPAHQPGETWGRRRAKPPEPYDEARVAAERDMDEIMKRHGPALQAALRELFCTDELTRLRADLALAVETLTVGAANGLGSLACMETLAKLKGPR